MSGPDPVNPYQSPTVHSDNNGGGGNPLLIPGIFLLVLAIMMLGLILLSIPVQIAQMREIDAPVGQVDAAVSMVTLMVWIIMTVAIIWGSIGMVRLRGYRNAMAAAVLAVIPVCSPCFVLGIPFGIWALVVLLRADVRAKFQG